MIGLSLLDFYEMTFRQFQNAVAGYEKKMQVKEQQTWEQSRWQVWAMLAPHQGKGKKLSMRDVMVFDWEKEVQELNHQKTQAELQAEFDIVNKHWNQFDQK